MSNEAQKKVLPQPQKETAQDSFRATKRLTVKIEDCDWISS